MTREIDIIYPDGSRHHVSVYRADLTSDRRVVISYYDLTNGDYADAYSEIVMVGNDIYKKPEHLYWDQYDFIPNDQNFSDSIIRLLPNVLLSQPNNLEIEKPKEEPKPAIAVADPHLPPEPPHIEPLERIEELAKKKTAKEYPPKVTDVRPEIRHIQAVFYAHEGTKVDLTPRLSGTSGVGERNFSVGPECTFFSRPRFIDYENPSIVYTKIEISDDKNNILSRLHTKLGDVIDTEDYFEEIRIDVLDKNIIYLINLSSCDDIFLYSDVREAESLVVKDDRYGMSEHVDELTAALHYECPLSMVMPDGTIKTNGVEPRERKSINI